MQRGRWRADHAVGVLEELELSLAVLESRANGARPFTGARTLRLTVLFPTVSLCRETMIYQIIAAALALPLNTKFEAWKKEHQKTYASIEEAETQIEREIATKLIASFKLASPSPTAAECKVALVAELEAMSAEALRID